MLALAAVFVFDYLVFQLMVCGLLYSCFNSMNMKLKQLGGKNEPVVEDKPVSPKKKSIVSNVFPP